MSLSTRANISHAFVCVDVFIDTKRVGGRGKANPCMCFQFLHLSYIKLKYFDTCLHAYS